jgi:hypothetical protein
MSKHGKKKSRKPRKHGTGLILLCDKCQSVQQIAPSALLARLADDLNALDMAGMHVKVLKGHIIAEGERGGGFVLPPVGEFHRRWTSHMETYHPSVPHLSRREDDLDS